MSLESYRELLAAVTRADLSVVELWLDSLSIGAALTQLDLVRILEGSRAVDPLEHDVLASALNDRFREIGHPHPVRYWDELYAA